MEQWVVIALGVAGFFLTWTGMVVSVTRAVATIKEDTAERVSTETEKITSRLNKLSEQFELDQRTQDSRFGEVALSIRQYIANVEKEMHQIEIWGRDNFVLKTDYVEAMRRLERSIEKMASDVRDNFKDLGDKIDNNREEKK